jgi:tetratricopeptide (TPR) repeat protein
VGVVHRDLKPSNILLSWEGEAPAEPAGPVRGAGGSAGASPSLHRCHPHVADFGLARRLAGDSGLTQTGALVGTPSYMAPEQTSGHKGAVTTATDVYGLGAVLYALLTRRPPFRGPTVLDTLALVREGEPERPRRLNPRVDRDLETICLHCLHKDPAKRYGSAEALAGDLERWLQGKPIQARPVTRRERVWRWCRRNPLLAGLLALVVLGSVGSAAWIGWQMRQTQAEKERAEQNLDMAFQVLDDLYIDQVGNRLLGQKELSADDRRFLERMRGVYQQFAEGNTRHPATRLKIAKALYRMSAIHFSLVDYPRADEANERAVRMVEQLAAEFPAETEYWRELAAQQINWGHALLLGGHIQEAERAYRRAGELGEQRLAGKPGDERAMRVIGYSHLNLGNVYAQTGQAPEAEQAQRQALQYFRRLMTVSPRDTHYPSSCWISLTNLREVLVDGYRLEELDKVTEEMQQLLQSMQEDYGEWKVELQLAEQRAARGFSLRARGRLKEAEAEYGKALALIGPVIATSPNSPDFAPRLAEYHLQLGLVLQAAGRREEAERSLTQALEPAGRMLARSPLPEYPSQVARIHLHLGALFQAAGGATEAEQSYEQARKLLEKVAKEFPDRATDRSNLGSVLDREAQLRLAEGKTADAVPLLEQALGHHEAARRSNPEHPIYRQYLGLHWHVLGVAQYRQGKWRDAVDTLEKGMALRAGGDGSDWFVLAMAHRQLGDEEQARKWYAQAVHWTEEKQPGDAELRRFRTEAAELLGIEQKND